ncbi:MAG: PAS-domain containing protein [Pseudomonadota bacterium]
MTEAREQTATPVRWAEFDAQGRLRDASPGFAPGPTLADMAGVLAGYATLRGRAVDGAGIAAALHEWSKPGARIEALHRDGRQEILVSHPSADVGLCLMSVPVGPQPAAEPALPDLAEALSSLSEAVAVFDEDGRFLLGNTAYRDLHAGLERFAVTGTHWETLLREMLRRRPVRGAAGREEAWIRSLLALTDEPAEFEIRFADDTVVSAALTPTRSGGFILTEIDITARRSAESAARESEQMLSKVLEASPATLCMASIGTGEVIYRSPAFTQLFGVEATAHSQFASGLARADFLTELLALGRIDDFEAEGINARGERFPALFSARVIDYRGEDVMVSSATDLTEQHRARRKIAEASTRLRDAIDAMDEGFALFDDQDRLILWNARYAAMNLHIPNWIKVGSTYEQILDAAIASGKLAASERDKIAETAERREMGQRRFEFQHMDGAWYSVARHRTSDGGFVLTRRDITERKKAEAAEREADALLRQVLEACPVHLILCRFEGGEIVFRSNSATEVFGARDRVSEYWEDLEAGKVLSQAIADSGRDERVFTLRRADDTPMAVALSSRLIEVRGEPMVVSHAYDLTDRMRMEDELARQQEMLHQSEKLSALGELLAGVAHELNNPLSVVVGHAMMLEEEAEDDALRRRASKIGSAADRCSRIVKTFLAMARQKPARPEPVQINEVIDTALDVAGYGLRSSGAVVVRDFADGLPPVMADADQLAQVFANLLVNAEHALADKGAEAEVRIATRLLPLRERVEITLVDNGPGIPTEIAKRIFEPFFTTKGVGQGTGIGLAFCHRIIASHDGTIRAGSAPGGGAQFTIELDAVRERPKARRGRRAENASGARVLVIDDEPDVAELIAQILAFDGHEAERAHSAEEALGRLGEGFDVILSDVNMPGLGGRGLLERLRADWPELEPRLAFVTGDTMSPGAEHFLETAGRPCVEKPVSPTDLRRVTAGLLRSQGARP